MDASLAGAMLMRGSTAHTRQQIREELDRLKARAGVGGGATQATLQIETVRDNLPATLTLMAEILRSPAFPAAEFDSLKQARLASIEESRAEPEAIAGNEFARHMNPYPKGDVRYRETIAEEIAELQAATVEKAQAVLPGLLRREQRAARRRGRLRRSGGDEHRARAIRLVEEPENIRTSAEHVCGGAARQPHVRDARQNERRVHGGHQPSRAGRRRRVSVARDGELHVRRRVPQLTSCDAAAPERRPQLRRQLAAAGELARQAGDVRGQSDLRAAKRRQARSGLQGRTRAGAPRRLHAGRTRRRSVRGGCRAGR